MLERACDAVRRERALHNGHLVLVKEVVILHHRNALLLGALVAASGAGGGARETAVGKAAAYVGRNGGARGLAVVVGSHGVNIAPRGALRGALVEAGRNVLIVPIVVNGVEDIAAGDDG